MINDRPKICFVTATPLTVHFFFKKHLRGLSEHYEVTLVYNPKLNDYVHPLEIPVREVGVEIVRQIAPLRDFMALYKLWRFFQKERFDGVISLVPKAGLLGMLAAYFARVPIRVHIFQGEVWAAKRGVLKWVLKMVDCLTARLATDALAVSFGEKRFLEEEGVVPKTKVEVLGSGSICGVDLARFSPDAVMRANTRALLKLPNNAVVGLFLGRIHIDKGIVELIDAFSILAAQHHQLWLLIVGPMENKNIEEKFKKLPRDISNRIIVEPFTKEPQNILRASDFLCLPSHREGFGMVILEAAAVGIPAIGSKIYGISEAIEPEKTGILIPKKDVMALAAAMKRLIENSEERICFSTAARHRVAAKFEESIVIERYIAYFNGLFLKKSVKTDQL